MKTKRTTKAAGEEARDTEGDAASRSKTRRSMVNVNPMGRLSGVTAGKGETCNVHDADVALLCRDLESFQRRREQTLGCRKVTDQKAASSVANILGHHFGEAARADRKQLYSDADLLITAVDKGKEIPERLAAAAPLVVPIILASQTSRQAYDNEVQKLEKEMRGLAKQLPIAKWAAGIKGFGMLRLAVVIGELGNPSDFATVEKVWMRMVNAPYKGKMPSTWRREGGLTAPEWVQIGYCMRRRAIMYVVSECLMKRGANNKYRPAYDQARASKQREVEQGLWTPMRSHRHGMLLMVKALLEDLWKEWRKATR